MTDYIWIIYIWKIQENLKVHLLATHPPLVVHVVHVYGIPPVGNYWCKGANEMFDNVVSCPKIISMPPTN